jgi:hypothetical protein
LAQSLETLAQQGFFLLKVYAKFHNFIVSKTGKIMNTNTPGFTQSNMQEFNKEYQKLMKDLAAKYGVQVNFKSFRFNHQEVRYQLSFHTEKKAELVSALEKKVLEKMGLPFDTVITYEGDNYLIKGYNERRPKNPISLVRAKDNKSMKCSVEFAKHYKRF